MQLNLKPTASASPAVGWADHQSCRETICTTGIAAHILPRWISMTSVPRTSALHSPSPPTRPTAAEGDAMPSLGSRSGWDARSQPWGRSSMSFTACRRSPIIPTGMLPTLGCSACSPRRETPPEALFSRRLGDARSPTGAPVAVSRDLRAGPPLCSPRPGPTQPVGRQVRPGRDGG